MSDEALFRQYKESLRSLNDGEFRLVIEALREDSTEGLEEAIGDVCPSWLENWLESLEVEELYSVDSDEPPVTGFGLVWDRGTDECWTYMKSTDDLFRGEKVKCGRSGLTPEKIWKLVQADLEEAGGNVVYEDASFNTALVPRAELEAYLRKALAEAGFTKMEADSGLPLPEWIEQLYGAEDERS